ncbi:hypothetical protein [Mucilaginibacter sp. KACC 22063]|uniref:hypothetical protein n=1 Tax=Mucilaginibacter sp. KACC 22063 TaxID=3025666 RepID=UPI002366D6AB|nr:hypothetical protein [Mucilaginibacter sp. KACC 22063]WDF54795.1 hypothetical protein PQ461_17840 [Mucilaginibacter sp. KACC 22063]
MSYQSTFFKNQLACVVAGIIGAIVTIRISRRYLAFIPNILFITVGVAFLLLSILYAFRWRQNSKYTCDINKRQFAFWEALIRYFIGLDMFDIGLGKIFHAQFRVPLGMLDLPFNEIEGSTLMWAFFGKHYSYTVIIAILQMAAGLLIVFRRTRLFGTIFLLPILLNIILLNYYYDFGPVVSIYTILLTLACVYLLLLEYDRLSQFFFAEPGTLPVFIFKNQWAKAVARASIVVIPFALVIINRMPLFYPEYTGSYTVKLLKLNNALVPRPKSSRDSVLTRIYIDKDDNDFVMDYNDYRRRFIGNYTYNKSNNLIQVIWHWPEFMHDTLTAQLLPGKAAGTKVLSGHMGKEVFKIEMQKQ